MQQYRNTEQQKYWFLYMRKGTYSCCHYDVCPLVGQSSGCLHVSSHVRSYGKPYVRQCRCLGVKQSYDANNKRTGWIKSKRWCDISNEASKPFSPALCRCRKKLVVFCARQWVPCGQDRMAGLRRRCHGENGASLGMRPSGKRQLWRASVRCKRLRSETCLGLRNCSLES